MRWSQVLLLVLVAGLAAWLGPFDEPDGWPALTLGMTLVAAMAIQNAAHRAHLTHAPPSTIMTGTTTQIMLDVADMAYGLRPEIAASTRTRFKRMTISVAVFAAGCGLAALLYAEVNKWCFCVLPLLGFATLMMRAEIAAADAPVPEGCSARPRKLDVWLRGWGGFRPCNGASADPYTAGTTATYRLRSHL